MNDLKKFFIIILICTILLIPQTASFADGLQDLSQLLKLFGETGVSSFHLDSFSFGGVDYDMLIRTIGNSSINYSELNYDAFLELFKDPEFSAALGVETVDEEALLTWLKNPATGEKINGMMYEVRDGGSFSVCVQTLYADPEFQDSFSLITNGKEFSSVMENLNSANASFLLNETAAALLSPRSGQPSETALFLSALVQHASDTLGWK